MAARPPAPPPLLVLGEFKDDAALCAAARALRQQGHARLDAHSPVPIHGADEALGLRRSPVPLIALVGALAGAGGGIAMQWWMNAVDYPINVAGRALVSWPTWIPIAFETTVLTAAVCIVGGLFALAGFPRLHHPVFELEAFRTASVDGLWLSVAVGADQGEPVAEELRRLGARNVSLIDGEDA
jgi:hypothetical protein